MSTPGKENKPTGDSKLPPIGGNQQVKLQPLDPTVKPTTKLEPVPGILPPMPPQQPLSPLTPIKHIEPKPEDQPKEEKKEKKGKTEQKETTEMKVVNEKTEKKEEVRPSSSVRPKSGTVYPALSMTRSKSKIETQIPNGKTPGDDSVKTITIDTHIWVGLVAMIMFPPLGIVAFIFSFQVYNSMKAGDIQRARWYSSTAQGIAWLGIGTCLACVGFFLISYWADLKLN